MDFSTSRQRGREGGIGVWANNDRGDEFFADCEVDGRVGGGEEDRACLLPALVPNWHHTGRREERRTEWGRAWGRKEFFWGLPYSTSASTKLFTFFDTSSSVHKM